MTKIFLPRRPNRSTHVEDEEEEES